METGLKRPLDTNGEVVLFRAPQVTDALQPVFGTNITRAGPLRRSGTFW